MFRQPHKYSSDSGQIIYSLYLGFEWLTMIPERVKVTSSFLSRKKSEDSETKLGPRFFILKRRMIKILQTQGFSSLVFVFQRPLCLPVHPAWNVAQKVDVVWSYRQAPECSCPHKKLKTPPTSSKAPGSTPFLIPQSVSRLIHFVVHCEQAEQHVT